jgi:hypothetical protein
MKKRNTHPPANILAYGLLWAFAASCGALPVYVHLNPERFGPPLMTFYGRPDDVNNPDEAEQARSTAALLRPRLQLDQITTGSVAPIAVPTRARVFQTQRQVFPEEPVASGDSVQFISATSTRALAVVDGRWVILEPGDRLPDGRLIARFEQANGTITPVAIDSVPTQASSPFSQR